MPTLTTNKISLKSHAKAVDDRQAFLDKISDTLFTSFQDDHTIKNIAQLIVSYIADYCRIVTLDENNNISDISVNHTDPSKVQLITDLYDEYKGFDATQGVHKILKTGKAELTPAIDKSVLDTVRDNPKLIKIVKDIGLKSYMGIPLTVHGKTMGAITFSSVRAGRIYNKNDLAFVTELGRRIALALDNARLYREAEKSRLEAERERQRLYDLFMQAPAMIAINHGPDHVYELANPLYLKMVGKTKDIIGMRVVDVFPELKSQGVIDILNKVYATGKPFFGNEHKIQLDINNTGKPVDRYFNFVYQPSRTVAGKVDGILVHAIDVTSMVETRHRVEKSEKYFRSLIEQSSDAIALTNIEGTVIYASPSVKKLLGYSSDEMIGKSGSIFIHPDDLEATQAKLMGIMQAPGKALTAEHRTIHKNGSVRWMETTVTNLADEPSVEAIVTNFRDITERRQAEELLRESKERATAVFDQAAAAMSLTSLDGQWIDFNRAYPKMFGYSRAQLKKMDYTHLTHPDDRAADRVNVALLLAGEIKEYRREKRYIHKNGSIVYATIHVTAVRDENGKPQYIIAVLQDITKPKLAEVMLRQSEERFRQLADSMPQMVWTAHSDGRLDYSNKQWYEYTGFKRNSNVKSWEPILHPDDVLYSREAWQRSVSTGEPFQIEYRFIDRKHPGKYRWFLGRALPVKNKKGEIVKWFGTCTDIDDVRRTIQRKNELEKITSSLTAQRAELVALNRAKDEFISLASHQLRTPATGVKQYLGMTLEGYAGKLTKGQTVFLRQAYESNEREINIINDLLQVAKVDAGKVALKKQKTDLVSMVGNVIQEQGSKFSDRKQKIIFTHTTNVINAVVDPQRMRMVVENIIDNASKYTPVGRNIEVSISRVKGEARIAIKDHGVGVGKNDIPKIFNKFSRLDNPLSISVGGTGLGLYWAKKIMDLHGGSIEVKSKLGSGSVFTVVI